MPASKKDYYTILGVTHDAQTEQIKDAFRTLALRYHPDRNKEPGAEEKFRDIAEAYSVLSNADKRAQYDQKGEAMWSDLKREDFYNTINFEEIFSDLGLGMNFGPFADFFGRKQSPKFQRAAHQELSLSIPLSEVMHGGEETIRVPHRQPCKVCKGSGVAAGGQRVTCELCHGTGTVVHGSAEGRLRIQTVETCRQCAGRGTWIRDPCQTCQAKGSVPAEVLVVLKIPAGIDEGTILHVAGYGQDALSSEGRNGDLFVTVWSQPHPFLKRSGADLWQTVNIPVHDAVLGCKLTVETLDGKVEVEVPSGTQPQTVLRVKAKGLPRFQERGHGDVFVVLQIKIPEQLSDQERQLYESLRKLRSTHLPREKKSWFGSLGI